MTLPTNWQDNVGNVVNAEFLNNLDTAVNAAYVKPGGGIGTGDLAAAVVTSLAKADTATQPADVAAAQLVSISTHTDSYTLVLGDATKAVEVSKATAVNVTVPPNASVAFPTGTVIEILQVGAGQVTVVAGSGVTINCPSTLKTRAQWSTLAIRKRATDTWVLSGDAE